jgi:nucleoside-diphosphate-sugar epimerase
VVAALLRHGFERVRCGVRRSSDLGLLKAAVPEELANRCEIVEANLLSREECCQLAAGVELVYHLVAGRGKSFPGCFQGSVITTRNLLDSLIEHQRLKRFVNVSSFAVYSRFQSKHGEVWDETCPLEENLHERHDAYGYGKLRQDELVKRYQERFGVPVTIVRPGIVFGPGKKAIPGFVGIDTFGFFMHLGGSGRLPLTYVDNCAEAIVLAGLAKGAEGEVFNVVDDDLPTSRSFLRAYKRQVKKFMSVPIPYPVTYGLCALWEWYAKHSNGQLPPVFNRRECVYAWKGHRYSNQKLKERLGWHCGVPMQDALQRYFEYQKNG